MCVRCGSENHFITNFPEPDTLNRKIHRNMEKPKTHAYRSTKIDKIMEKSTDQSESQNMYASMACMPYNVEITCRYFGDISQLPSSAC